MNAHVHPGALDTLRMLAGDELDIAELMRDGIVPSPHILENMALFKVRVTGTGYAYRPALREYVYRRPEHYLSERFLRRINGLPVIWEHPEDAVLSSAEFGKRIVGTVFVPFHLGEEVWAIAKIFNKAAVHVMSQGDTSTSPAVVFHDPSVNMRIEREDGTTMLVEGDASRVDHLAICENGVWDKGETPSGVIADGDPDELGEQALLVMADSLDALAKRVNSLRVLDRLGLTG